VSKRRVSNREMRAIAEHRMAILLDLSRLEALSGRSERSQRYFKLAKAIGMRTNTPLPRGTLYCRKCESLMLPGRNCRVRLRNGRIVMHCLDCDTVRRRPYVQRNGEVDAKEAEQEGAQRQGHRA
jgi:ribonuclease P protein subunit RPR2